MDKGIITFFDVEEVGFYTKSRNGDSEKITGSLLETVGNLAKWITKCNGFTDTIPWDTEKYENRIPIYSKAAYTDPDTNDTLIVFWAGVEDQEVSRRGIKASAKTGSSQDDSVNLKDAVPLDKTVVGQAMYYWFIPSHNLLATIDFRHSRLKSNDVFSYIQRCVYNKLDLANSENGLIKIKEERENPSGHFYTRQYYKCSKSNQNLYFRFNAKMKIFSSSTVNLKKLASSITHIVVRDKVSYSPDNNMGNELKMLGAFINVFKDKEDDTDRKPVEYIEKRSITEDELKQLIINSEKELETEDDWIGMGFQSGANEKPKFFKSFIHRPTVMISKEHNMGNYYNAKYFLKYLTAQRESLILTPPNYESILNSDVNNLKEIKNESIDN